MIEAKRRTYDSSSSQRALYFHAEPDEALVYAMEHPLPFGATSPGTEAPPDAGGAERGDQQQ